jgi:hypothetical protein
MPAASKTRQKHQELAKRFADHSTEGGIIRLRLLFGECGNHGTRWIREHVMTRLLGFGMVAALALPVAIAPAQENSGRAAVILSSQPRTELKLKETSPQLPPDPLQQLLLRGECSRAEMAVPAEPSREGALAEPKPEPIPPLDEFDTSAPLSDLVRSQIAARAGGTRPCGLDGPPKPVIENAPPRPEARPPDRLPPQLARTPEEQLFLDAGFHSAIVIPDEELASQNWSQLLARQRRPGPVVQATHVLAIPSPSQAGPAEIRPRLKRLPPVVR